MAFPRLELLERRLQKTPLLAEKVKYQIANYERKIYAHKATPVELTSVDISYVWYLPIGLVTCPKSRRDVIQLQTSSRTRSANSTAEVLCQFHTFTDAAVSRDLREMFH